VLLCLSKRSTASLASVGLIGQLAGTPTGSFRVPNSRRPGVHCQWEPTNRPWLNDSTSSQWQCHRYTRLLSLLQRTIRRAHLQDFVQRRQRRPLPYSPRPAFGFHQSPYRSACTIKTANAVRQTPRNRILPPDPWTAGIRQEAAAPLGIDGVAPPTEADPLRGNIER